MKISIQICLVLCCALLLGSAEAREKSDNSLRDNLTATRNHYTHLISGNTPNIAELTLFTNMLPKGGDVHHHYSGAIYAETYLDWVEAQNFCIYTSTDASLKIERFRIESKPQELSDAARQACASADAVRNDNAFYRELLQRWSDKDYGNHFHQQPAPDQQFFDTFGYFGTVSGYDVNKGLQSLKVRAKDENISYLETMLKGGPSVENREVAALIGPLTANTPEQQMHEALDRAFAILAGDAETLAKIDGYVKSLEAAASGLDDEDFKLRFQTYVSRNNPPAQVFGSLFTSFAAAGRTPLVVGVNILGPENRHVAMRDYSLHMKMFEFFKRHYPGVKLSLHAGELVLGMIPPEGLRHHIREAVLVAGADRIGHGIDIAHETDAPQLLNIMKQKKVAVEVNLTSNEFILGIKNEAHPVGLYARHGVPFVISTDDPGVSRNNLSGEYLLYTSRYKPSYDNLKEVVYNSIHFSFLSKNEKAEEIVKLDKRFARFEARIASLPPQAR
ncbi:MAG: adenosine deaminase [Desulforhopalus sp.]|nr:adenosine deaminase [Desulforhopalus sp.]